MADSIMSLVSAETGWRALYSGELEEDAEMTRIIAWALVEGGEGERRVVGLVVDPNDPTKIVPASEGAGPVATQFDRYGFKPDL